MTSYAFCNGKSCSAEWLSERAFSYADGVFETMRCQHGSILLLTYHYARLARACAVLKLNYDQDQLQCYVDQALQCCAEHGLSDAVVKITLGRARADSPRASYPLGVAKCQTYLQVTPFSSKPYARGGVVLRRAPEVLVKRSHALGLKLISRLDYILPTASMRLAENEEALFCDDSGYLIETMHHNLCFIKDNTLVTAPLSEHGVHGVFRAFLLAELAPAFGLKVVLQALHAADVEHVDGAFICNAIDGIIIVKQIDTVVLPSASVLTSFQTFVQAHFCES